jgi:hypothetical protein
VGRFPADPAPTAERLYYRHGFRRTGVRGTVGGGDIRPEFEMVLDL